MDGAVAAAQVLLRINTIRAQEKRKALIPRAIVIECEEPSLTDEQWTLLVKAAGTGFTGGPPFESPDEARAFFRRSTIDHLWGEDALADCDDDTLIAMGEAVILARLHCAF